MSVVHVGPRRKRTSRTHGDAARNEPAAQDSESDELATRIELPVSVSKSTELESRTMTIEESKSKFSDLHYKAYVKKHPSITYHGTVSEPFDLEMMKPMTYARGAATFDYETVFPDGEVEGKASVIPDSYVIKGALGEVYTVAKDAAKLLTIYAMESNPDEKGSLVKGARIQARVDMSKPRLLHEYKGPQIKFMTEYGGTVCHEGDYIQTNENRSSFSRVKRAAADSDTGFRLVHYCACPQKESCSCN